MNALNHFTKQRMEIHKDMPTPKPQTIDLFLFRTWGRGQDAFEPIADAMPHVHKFKDSALHWWFTSKEARDKVAQAAREFPDVLVIDKIDPPESMRKAIATYKLMYRGKGYAMRYDGSWGYGADNLAYYLTDGNLGCDCNRLTMIDEQHGTAFCDEYENSDPCCGDEIELVDLEIRYEVIQLAIGDGRPEIVRSGGDDD